MHRIELLPVVTERARLRRGRLHAIDRIELRRTALLVIDMQNGFVAPGAPAEVPTAREIVPAINRLAALVRSGGGAVIWVRNEYDRRLREEWSVYFDLFNTPLMAEAMMDHMTPGHWGCELWPELDVRPDETVFGKRRYSAFVRARGDLERLLRDRGVDTVLVAGTLTNVCCESTARDATMRNFRTVMVADCTATRSDEEHNASLSNFLNMLGDVLTVDEIAARAATEQVPA